MSEVQSKNALVDALGLWEKEAAGAAGRVDLLRIDGSERMLLPFTTQIVRVDVHYLDYPSCQGYYRCNVEECLLCRIGRQKDRRDLWPVYDVVARQVGVLALTTNTRPGSLRPTVLSIMKQLKDGGERQLMIVRQEDRRFFVSTPTLSREVDDGAAIIQQFLEDFKAGKIDLASVYTQLPNDEFAAVPAIAMAMKVKGVAI